MIFEDLINGKLNCSFTAHSLNEYRGILINSLEKFKKKSKLAWNNRVYV